MDDYLNLWEKKCQETQQKNFTNDPIIKHEINECLKISEPFYVILDIVERMMNFPEEQKEIVLYLSNGPSDEIRYAHLIGKWAVVPVSIGMIISIIPKNGWAYDDDDQNLYRNSLCCYVNDTSYGFVIFPHYLVKTSSFSVFKRCPRAVFFKETHMLNDPTLFSLYGRFATIGLQRYIKNACSGNNISAADIIDQLKQEYILQISYIASRPINDRENSIKTLNDFYNIVNGFAEKVDEQHAVLMTVPHSNNLLTISKAFPGFGAKSYVNDETIWSFSNGIVGRSNCVVEVEDEKNSQYVPIDVIGTIGNTYINGLRNGHIFSITAQSQLLSERFNKDVAKYGFIWYIGSNQKFWIHPSENEFIHLRQIRNNVASNIANDDTPPKQVSNDCDSCLSRVQCALFERMKDKREFVDEIDEILPKSFADFSLNMSRTFFNHHHKIIWEDSLSMMWCCIRISTSKLHEREKAGHALGHLTITEIQVNKDIYTLILTPQIIGDHLRLNISRLDELILTKNGSMPILGFGFGKIRANNIEVKTYQTHFKVGEMITIDRFISGQWYAHDNAALSLLLTHKKFNRIKSFLIDVKPPLFQFNKILFDSEGLNHRQAEVVSKAIRANDYVLINAPNGTGRIPVGLRIISCKLQQNPSGQILVVPFFYATINKICKGLEFLKIPYVISGKEEKIDDPYKYRLEDAIFSSCKTNDEVNQKLNQIRVFIICSLAKPFNLLFDREFDLVIMYEASKLPLVRSIYSLWPRCPLILFGDSIYDSIECMDSHYDNTIFSHLQKINANQVLHLWDMYNCEPSIVAAARIIWGNELRCSSQHAFVDIKPLKVISKDYRRIFENIVSMDHPIVFINVPIDDNFKDLIYSTVMITISAGLIYPKVNVISNYSILPKISAAIFKCQTDSESVFIKYNKFLQHAAERVKYYYSRSVMSQRKDTVIVVADSPDSIVLQLALGMTRRKLILIGNLEIVSKSPLWSTMLNQLPQDLIIDFPADIAHKESSPFRQLDQVF